MPQDKRPLDLARTGPEGRTEAGSLDIHPSRKASMQKTFTIGMFRYSMYRIPKLVLQVPALPQREYVGMQTLKPPFLPSKCDPELTKRSDQTGLKSYTNNVKQKTQNKLSSKTQIQNKLNSKTQIRLKSDSTRTSTHTQGASCLLNLRLAFMSSTQSCLSLLVP